MSETTPQGPKEQLTETPDTTKLPAMARAEMLANETSLYLNVAKFEHTLRVATMLSKSNLVPDRYKNKPGDCFIVLDFSSRINCHPLMLMQSMYCVYGNPGLEGKLVASLVNQSHRFIGEIEYQWLDANDKEISEAEVINNHEKDLRGCRAFAKSKATGKTLYGPKITWKMVYEEGWYADKKRKPPATGTIPSKWKTLTALMFPYRAASYFANRYCPEVKLGMMTTEELHDIVDLTPSAAGVYGPSEDTAKDMTEALKSFSGPSEPEEKKHKEEKPEKKASNEAHPWDHAVWKNMRTGDKVKTGFAVHVMKNLDTFNEAPAEIQELARNKYVDFYKEPWPGDTKESEDESQSAGSDEILEDGWKETNDTSTRRTSLPSDSFHKLNDNDKETSIKKFDRLCIECIQSHEDYSEPLLAHFLTKFITETAEVNEIDVEALKTDCAADFVTFWTEFNTWLSKQDLATFSPTGHTNPQGSNISDPDGENEEDLEAKRMQMIEEIKNVGQRNAEVKRAAYDKLVISPGAALSFFDIKIVKELYDTCIAMEKEFAM